MCETVVDYMKRVMRKDRENLLASQIEDMQSEYIQLYYNNIKGLFSLSITEAKILFCLLRDCEWAENFHYINMDNSVRESIQEQIGKKRSTFFAAINHFTKQEILIKQCNGGYSANPFIFAKGEYSMVEQCREMERNNLAETYRTKKTPFVKLFLDDLSYLDLLTKGDFAVLLSLFGHVQRTEEMHRLKISKGIRLSISNKTGLKDETIYKSVNKLCSINLIGQLNLEKQTYQVNPFYFQFGFDYHVLALKLKYEERHGRHIIYPDNWLGEEND